MVKLSNRYLKLIKEDLYNVKDEFWNFISRTPGLSENFIQEFQVKVNWYNVFLYQELSEEFIIEFQDKDAWELIFRNQNLSEEFMLKFTTKKNLKALWLNPRISIEAFKVIESHLKSR